MSGARRLKRNLIKQFGVEKFSERIKKQIKHEGSRPVHIGREGKGGN